MLFKKEKKGLWKGENYDLFKKDLLFYCQEEKKGSNLLLVEMDFSRGLWPSDLSDKEIKINDDKYYISNDYIIDLGYNKENIIKRFDMIDIGGESTSPGRKEVQIEEEI